MAADSAEREFAQYFASRRDVVRRTAYLLCGDWHWADDLTQVTFVRVAAAWTSIRDRGALDAFVRTCLIRAYLAETRRLFRRRERTVAELPDRPAGDSTEDTARRLAFAEALRRVPPRQRATLVLRYYHGLDVTQTAVELGCTEGTVKSQTARGLATLRTLLGDELLEPRFTTSPRGIEGR